MYSPRDGSSLPQYVAVPDNADYDKRAPVYPHGGTHDP